MSLFHAVLKVGGSLGRGPDLGTLGAALAGLAGRYRLLVVPGGGEFADLVRAQYRRYRLSETSAHRMALLAMDQFAYLLAGVVPGGVNVADLGTAHNVAAAGGLPILLPATLLLRDDPLPNSWQVTSDSLAAWIAGVAGAPRLVLLKDVDGLFARAPAEDTRGDIYRVISVAELAGHWGGVDEYLATVLAQQELETWIVNGSHPERLAELLDRGTTYGTRICRTPADAGVRP